MEESVICQKHSTWLSRDEEFCVKWRGQCGRMANRSQIRARFLEAVPDGRACDWGSCPPCLVTLCGSGGILGPEWQTEEAEPWR